MDLATATGQDRDALEIGGKAYGIGPLTAGQWGGMQAWIKANVKSPLARAVEQLNEMDAAGVRIKPTDRATILDGARKEGRVWPPSIGSAAWLDCLRSEEGDAAFVFHALKPFNPDLTPEDAAAVVAAWSPEHVEQLMLTALGARPDDPKAPPSSGDSPA
jgi:hypothetical protein